MSIPTAPQAFASRPLRALTALATLVLLALAAVAPPPARADDEEWKARISKSLGDVEVQLAVLDKKPPMPGSLAERAAMLNQRLVALETELGLVAGGISGKNTLFALSADAAALNTRVQKVIAAKNAPKNAGSKPKPPPDPDPKPDPKAGDPPPDDPKKDPKKKDPRAWPSSLEFTIGARITYEETGSWMRIETTPGYFEDRFLMDGYSARLSFSMWTKGLLSNIKSAKVRVAIRMQGPLSTESDLYRTYDVDWVAENVMNNESKANWMNHDQFAVSGPTRWTTPRKAQMKPEAHAHVLSVTLPDGTTKQFEAPKYRTQ
jgi:hypothetical protein